MATEKKEGLTTGSEGDKIVATKNTLQTVQIHEEIRINAGRVLLDAPSEQIEAGERVEEQPLFLSGKTGKPIANETAAQWLKRLNKKAKRKKAVITSNPEVEKEEKQKHLLTIARQLRSHLTRQELNEEAVAIWMSAEDKAVKLSTQLGEAVEIWGSTEIAREEAEARVNSTEAKNIDLKDKIAENARLLAEKDQLLNATTVVIRDLEDKVVEKDNLLDAAELAKVDAETKLNEKVAQHRKDIYRTIILAGVGGALTMLGAWAIAQYFGYFLFFVPIKNLIIRAKQLTNR